MLLSLLIVSCSTSLWRVSAAWKENPVIESNKLRGSIEQSCLLAKAKTLEGFAYSTPLRNRQNGTPGHNSTVNWLLDTILEYPDYYDVYLEPYTMLLNIGANLTVNGEALEVYALGMSPSGKAKGQLIYVPNLGCAQTDFPANVTGNIALISRGSCQSAVKVALAGVAGAKAVVVYNSNPPDISSMNGYSLQRVSTPEGPYVPTGGITRTDGQALVARLAAGEEIIADLSTETVNKTTYNVIAQTKAGDPNNVLLLGAHSDSVAPGPGINDNGSGTISILEVAIQLVQFSVKNAVRFAWWAAEEPGLLGSTYYVANLNQSEREKIRLVLNFDMLASPNYVYAIYDGDGSTFNSSGPPGSAEAEKVFQEYLTNEAHQNWTETEFDGSSDYGPFLDVGIACGGLFTGANDIKSVEEQAMFGGVAGIADDINYHRPGDNVSNLNMEAWLVMTKAVAHATALFAASWDELPVRNETIPTRYTTEAKRSAGWLKRV